MSNALAIAAVTATLRNLLEPLRTEFPGTVLSAKPVDEARRNDTNNQVNLFLYQVRQNEAWRNRDMPRQTLPGEVGFPPLGLDLYYLLTVYGASNEDDQAHRVLGRAMNLLNDRAVLSREQLRSAIAGSDLHEQIERVRIRHEPLSMDDLFKMWASFQTEYRLSTAYQVSVVLIESTRERRAPLPVLERTVRAHGSIIPPFPTVESVTTDNGPHGARLGETITLEGHHLSGDTVRVLFSTPRLTAPIERTPDGGSSATEVLVTLPDDTPAQSAWVVGMYRLVTRVTTTDSGVTNTRETNQMPLVIAPRITNISPNPLSLAADTELTLTVRPFVQTGQEASLLLGEHAFAAETVNDDQVTFDVDGIAPGKYHARLRVDGIDSILVDHSVTPPAFDSSVQVTINP